MQFGRKSEKLDRQIEQLELRLEELEADEGAAPIEIPKSPRTAPEQSPRKPLPEHLPREVQTHLPEALERIGALYKIEEAIRGKPPDARRAYRQEHARPLLDQLHAWLAATLETLSKKSDTSRAILYALNRWEALTLYCDDGRVEIDNLSVERALRGHRKAELPLAGADSGGERAAAIYSLIGSAKLNDIDPEAYLRFVLARLGQGIRSRAMRP